MNSHRKDALTKLIGELEEFEIGNDYFDDLEPQGFYDSAFLGKINSLIAFCQTLGWSELVAHMKPMMEMPGNAPASLDSVKTFVIPEIRRLLAITDIDSSTDPTQWFWDLIRPRICALSKPRYQAGFYADAVESAFKEVNEVVKRLTRDRAGRELDGASLMNTAFSPGNPLIKLTPMVTESDRNIQQGYMQMMAGSMTGIRNPKAHANVNPDSRMSLHMISLASLFLLAIDSREPEQE